MQETAKKTNAGSSEEKENQTKKDAFKRRDGVFRGRICFKLSLHMEGSEGIPFQRGLNLNLQIQTLEIGGLGGGGAVEK